MTDTNDGLPEVPEGFGAEFAEAFANPQFRSFDPNASRGASEGGDPPGGPVAAMGNEPLDDGVPPGGWPGGDTVDASQQLPPPVASPAPAAVEQEGEASDGLPSPAGLPAPTPEVSAPVVDGQPGGGTVEGAPVTPAAGAPSDPSAELPPPTGYVYNYDNNGQPASITFSDDEVQTALSFHAWGKALPDEVRAAFLAIEEGQAVAIPRADLDRYTAWQKEQQRGTRDRDLEQFDEDAAREIQRLRDENAQLTGQPQQPLQPQGFNQHVDQNLTHTAQGYQRGADTWQAARGLTDPEMNSLMDSVVASEIVPSLTRQYTQFNPATGKPIRPADPALVITKALDAALAWNPQLHTASLTRQQTPTAPITTPSPVPAANDPVSRKKSNAASLASAPSAAVPPTPRNTTLTGQDAVNAMAAELLDFMNR